MTTARPGSPPSGPAPRRGFPWRKLLLGVLASMAIAALACASAFVCLPAWLRWGLHVDTCPDGRPAQTAWLSADMLRRGVWREVRVGATAWYTPDRADSAWQAPLRPGRDVALELVDAQGQARPMEPRDGWSRSWSDARAAEIMLPADLPDGDYTLRATLRTRLGESRAEAPLPLYAPARVHVLTDRPLYEPGHEIRMRALALRAADLTPLDGRPGTWTVTDPEGTVLLEERVPAGAWGVAEGSFPLDAQSPSGTWTIRWVSGQDQGEAQVQVEPFTLPRFRVEAHADLPFWQAGQVPVVRGRVVYSSGAPVAGAALALSWSSQGDWPPPSSWLEGGLPTAAATDPAGAFVLALPEVPADLLGQATLSARIEATDEAGDRVTGGVSLLLSQDPLAAQAVTELGEGLVASANNRLYLRVTTADGVPLPDTDLRVQRAWDPGDEGEVARTDADGVAALQIDPGAPVTVVVPAPPVRPPPRAPLARIRAARTLPDLETADLLDQRRLDEALPALGACARFGSATHGLPLRVAPSGQVEAFPPADPGARCLAEVLRGRRLAPGTDRLLEVQVELDGSELPRVDLEASSWPEPDGEVLDALRVAAQDAGGCLPEDVPELDLPRALEWRRTAGTTRVEVRWIAEDEVDLPPGLVACVEARLARVAARTPATVDLLGRARGTLHPSPRVAVGRAQDTTLLGYELRVTALDGAGVPRGATTVRLAEGAVPTLRLRASPILAAAGGEVVVDVLRGPDFQGELPEKLPLTHQSGKVLMAGLDPETRQARWTLPEGQDGWYTVSWGGAEARVFVRPQGELSVAVGTEADRYAPGQVARIQVLTRQGDQAAPAAVGLFGVDESLGQLAALPGPDALQALRDPVTTASPAFGVLDGQALALGRIRGDAAAAATVLRVSQVPSPADTDRDVAAHQEGGFDPVAPLTDRFYVALAALHEATRAWEAGAAAGVQMDNATMATLWEQALDDCAARGEAVEDAYGRRLRLHRLPDDLLALTDPRAVVIDGTRLPEDVEAWIPWVQEEEP